MKHYSEEEMIEYQMQESGEAEAIRLHLGECVECAALDESVAETLRTFSDGPVPAAEFERSWQRVRGQLGVHEAAPQRRMRPVETTSLLEEGGVFASLWSSLRDVFFPEKLPPLHLESKPIAVVDRMAFKRNPASTAMAIAIYAVLILIIAYVQRHHLVNFADKALKLTELEAPPPVPPKKDLMGGGGGQKGPTPVSKGNLPKIVEQKIILPKIETPPVPTIDLPKDLKMPTVPLANLGDPNSPRVGMSMGNGNGTGIGSGTGGGLGPGSGGLTGGGVRHIGGGVLPPVVIYQVEPEFSEEARKAKFAGNVLVALYVDTLGRPVNVHIIRGVGMGLDEKAVEAVKQYKFKPAMENGKPVLVDLNIEVNFQIF